MTRTRSFVLGALALTLLFAGVVSYWASSSPDGLNKVAEDLGFSSSQQAHASDGSPLAGYSTKGVTNPWVSKAISGVAGVGITLAIGGGLFLVLRRSQRSQVDAEAPTSTDVVAAGVGPADPGAAQPGTPTHGDA